MTDQDKEYLRDLFAGFALIGLLIRGNSNNTKLEPLASSAYAFADDMLEARKQSGEGIVAIKRRVKAK
jgi:hypothetical protein